MVKKLQLNEYCGLTNLQAQEIYEKLDEAWHKSKTIPEVITYLIKDRDLVERQVAFAFLVLGRRIEDNEIQGKAQLFGQRVQQAIKEIEGDSK